MVLIVLSVGKAGMNEVLPAYLTDKTQKRSCLTSKNDFRVWRM